MKILVIDGHPNPNSLCAAAASTYVSAAERANFENRVLRLRELNFDLNFHRGYQEIQELEPDLLRAQQDIKWCEHLVFVYPIWWGTMPALTKGFLDRAWLPGFAFKYHEKDPGWDRLLKGRSARMIVTSDAPVWFNHFKYWSAPYRVMRQMVLRFSGFQPVHVTAFGRIKDLDEVSRGKMLAKIATLGTKGI